MIYKKQKSIGDALQKLTEIVENLRAPGGCPWDKEQTIQSLVPFTLEETYELIDAVERNDTHDLCAELGDLLFHIVSAACGIFRKPVNFPTLTHELIEISLSGLAPISCDP